jgi:hypothetical protein
MTDATTHLARAIERLARSETSTHNARATTTTPSRREVDAIYDDLIARLGETLATLSSDDADTTPHAGRRRQ